MSSSVLSMFSFKSFYSFIVFIVSGLTFRSLIPFKFIFVDGVRKQSNFILFHVAVKISQQHLQKKLSLPHCIFLPPLSKIRCPQVRGFISGLSILFHWSIFLFFCQYHTVWIIQLCSHSEVRKVDSSSSIFLSQDCFGCSSFFVSIQTVKVFVLIL